MTGGWAPRRFWSAVSVAAEEGGFAVRLDARPLRTPGRAALLLPTRALAEAVAAEWAAQGERIEPAAMPLTRAANTAIDRVAPDPGPLLDELARFGAADLLCYRAEAPAALVRRQAAAWDPLLDWAADELGARLTVGAGIVFIPQPESSLAALRRQLAALSPFALTALSELVALSGSLVIGLAVASGRDAAALWEVACLDERWQAELWGEDAEAAAANRLKRGAFLSAERLLRLAGPEGG